MIVAKADAGTPTCTDRLDGSTTATRGAVVATATEAGRQSPVASPATVRSGGVSRAAVRGNTRT